VLLLPVAGQVEHALKRSVELTASETSPTNRMNLLLVFWCISAAEGRPVAAIVGDCQIFSH
jgi:hypothetical protein